jgi:hypothetical protein
MGRPVPSYRIAAEWEKRKWRSFRQESYASSFNIGVRNEMSLVVIAAMEHTVQ